MHFYKKKTKTKKPTFSQTRAVYNKKYKFVHAELGPTLDCLIMLSIEVNYQLTVIHTSHISLYNTFTAASLMNNLALSPQMAGTVRTYSMSSS